MRPTLRAGLIVAVFVFLQPASFAADSDANPKKLRVALVQMALRPSLTENRDRIVQGIAQAAERQARVAVFPERALTGADRKIRTSSKQRSRSFAGPRESTASMWSAECIPGALP